MESTPAYKPTSLDFINRPNPVEPQSVPQKHPLNGTTQLAKLSDQDLRRLLYDANGLATGERATKRRKSGEGKSLDLPKLPVRQSAKRLRIPPTLSGLHQPPPNAGLLPSISTEQPQKAPPSASEPGNEVLYSASTAKEPSTAETAPQTRQSPAKGKTEKAKRNKWSEEETEQLLKGVARFGIGSWTKILNCTDYNFEKRTALDLKDRFRVCCPSDDQRNRAKAASKRPHKSERKSSTELQDLGINQPFEKVERRRRHGYSAAEDEALLEGFRKHGNQWAAIRADEGLDLAHRRATDLRDRMRTKYPEQYAKAGLAPRPQNFPKSAKRGKENEDSGSGSNAGQTAENDPSVTETALTLPLEKPARLKHAGPTSQSQMLPMPEEDVFFGAPFDDDSAEAERITLDRGILDWPFEVNRHSVFDAPKTANLDPISVLNLPRPGIAWPQSSTMQPGGSSALPSLAAVTAFNEFDPSDQLELPSLVLGALESDGRAGGHFLGFDELLS